MAAQFVPPVWTCGNDNSTKPTTRHLFEEEEDEHHDHDDHDHSHQHEHDHSTTDGIDLSDIKNELRNSNLRLGKRRELQTATRYKFQVDMYIEIDFDLCAKHGESCTNGVGPQTLNYINVLFAGANTVYEVSTQRDLCGNNDLPSCEPCFVLFAMQLVLNLVRSLLSPTERNRYPPQRVTCCRQLQLCFLYRHGQCFKSNDCHIWKDVVAFPKRGPSSRVAG